MLDKNVIATLIAMMFSLGLVVALGIGFPLMATSSLLIFQLQKEINKKPKRWN